jgi:hypothetical protein
VDSLHQRSKPAGTHRRVLRRNRAIGWSPVQPQRMGTSGTRFLQPPEIPEQVWACADARPPDQTIQTTRLEGPIPPMTPNCRRSELSPGLPSASSYRTPVGARSFMWLCLIGVILVGGCSTADSRNTSPNPWNRPTKADVSQGWWFKDWYPHHDEPGGLYP